MSRILIAEDEGRLAAFLEKGLRANGFATTTAADGPYALALARGEDFDLLILDLGLPGLDGLSVLRAMRERGVRMPVVILSARDEVVGGLERGADDYVRKPFRFEELLARGACASVRRGRPSRRCCARATWRSTCAPGAPRWAS